MSETVPVREQSQVYKTLIAQRREDLKSRVAAIFPTPADFVCEIGSGHGHFLTEYARQHPDQTCIGIDIIGDRVLRANRKKERARLKHLHFLLAEAALFMDALPDHATISLVFILFPDPWPKTRHHKHRILQHAFLDSLSRRMSGGAPLFFRTDYRPYFEDARATLQANVQWEVMDAPWPFEHETVFQQRAAVHYSLSARLRHKLPVTANGSV
jgi:tRNA (guanine-N7-)-methyltransferase